MRAALIWTSLLVLVVLIVSGASSAIELDSPEKAVVGEKLLIRWSRALEAPATLVVNHDFGFEFIELEPGQVQTGLTVTQSGLARLTLLHAEGTVSGIVRVIAEEGAEGTKMELTPRSEPVDVGRVQAVVWVWDRFDNRLDPPGDIKVLYPHSQESFPIRRLGIVGVCSLGTTTRTGLCQVEAGTARATFRQVSGPPVPFELTLEQDNLRTSELKDKFGNRLDDGTRAVCIIVSGEEEAVWQTQVLNGVASFAFESPPGKAARIQVEVMGEKAWLAPGE